MHCLNCNTYLPPETEEPICRYCEIDEMFSQIMTVEAHPDMTVFRVEDRMPANSINGKRLKPYRPTFEPPPEPKHPLKWEIPIPRRTGCDNFRTIPSKLEIIQR